MKKHSKINQLNLPSLILASGSPRRHALLEALGLQHKVVTSATLEEIPYSKSSLKAVALKNALAKASSALLLSKNPQAIAIGADTLVFINDQVLGKPHSKREARKYLNLLSGNTHTVVTGLALTSPFFGTRKRAIKSRVTFRILSDQEIDSYISIQEPYDKAGAYAIQGIGALFIKKIQGSYTNVMGLPIEAFLEELSRLSGISVYHWIK